MYAGYEPEALGFFYSMKPPTGVILIGFPFNKACLENIRWKKSTCGSILSKASQTVMKPAICSTLVRLRCYSSRPHSLRSPHRNQCMGYPSPRSWKERKEMTSLTQGRGKTSPVGALQCATSFGGSTPFSAKVANTDSVTTDDLQLDIALWIHERIYEFLLSLALPFFS